MILAALYGRVDNKGARRRGWKVEGHVGEGGARFDPAFYISILGCTGREWMGQGVHRYGVGGEVVEEKEEGEKGQSNLKG